MKSEAFSLNRPSLLAKFFTLGLCAATMASAPSVRAQATYYWDNNGATAGFGTASGTWATPTTGNSTQGWSTDSTGLTDPSTVNGGSTTTTSSDSINFGTSTNGLAGGTITVSGTQSVGSIVFGAASTGNVILSGGTISLAPGGSITSNTTSNSNVLTINSNLDLGGGTATINENGGNVITLTIGGIISNGAITKTGSGILTLSGVNTFTGGITISGGTVRLINSGQLGAGSYAGNISTVSGSSFQYNSGATQTISGVISGGGTVGVNGGNLTLTGANTNAAFSNINNATLNVTSIGGIGVASSNMGAPTTVAQATVSVSGATLNYTGVGETTNRVFNANSSGTGAFILTNNGTGTLTLVGDGTHAITSTGAGSKIVTLQGSGTGVVSGAIDNATGTIGITKAGTGTWTLSGTNTYTGVTTVTVGTLLVNGTHNGGSTNGYVVGASGILGGTGAITTATMTTAAGSKLTPGGNGIGDDLTITLATSGSLMNISASSNDTGAYLFDLGLSSDKIVLTLGTLNIGTMTNADFVFTEQAGFGVGTYVLFDAASTIIGSVTSATDSIIFSGGLTGTLSIDAINNDVLLTVVPEPTAFGMLVAVAGVFGLWRGCRRNG